MAAATRTSLPPWYTVFRSAIFALLICNAAFYLYTGTLSEALDTVAWLALLILFELETGEFGVRPRIGASGAIRAARLLAAVTSHGFIDDYSGVRISKSGRRFRIHRDVNFTYHYRPAVGGH